MPASPAFVRRTVSGSAGYRAAAGGHSSYGYSHTKIDEWEVPETANLGMRMEMWPALHHGSIDHHSPNGFSTVKNAPVYVHDAETLSGLSGGPLLNPADSCVYGITSAGSVAYGIATDIRAVFDEPIPFIEGEPSLRDLAGAGIVSIR
jgi:hypothetical protein